MMRVDEDFYEKVIKITQRLNSRDKKRIETSKTRPYQAVEITGWIAEDIKIGDYVK